MSSKMGMYLRQHGGGPVEVMLRVSDMALRVDAQKGVGGSGQELVAFTANDFREIGNGDLWEFQIVEKRTGEDGKQINVPLAVAVTGDDILMVRTEGRLAS